MTTVLVVDDAAIDRRVAGACVEEAGFKATYAENGREALDSIKGTRPDIVLTDLQMPELDGLELVKRLRSSDPTLPTILMTAWGSEDTAVAALREGAASYVNKKKIKRDLSEALRVVLASIESTRGREQVRNILQFSEAYFKIGYKRENQQALVSYLIDGLGQLGFCDQSGLRQVSTALIEALANAIDHGNLELDSALREDKANEYKRLGDERTKISPYMDRRVHIRTKLTQDEATFVIQDEGTGFDVSSLPDPRDPENLLKPSGRGVVLIYNFMDEVSYNDSGNEITMRKYRSKK